MNTELYWENLCKRHVSVPYNLVFLFNVGPGFFLCNVGVAFAATGYYQKINQFKIKTAEKWCYSGDIALDFSYAILPGVSWTTLHRIFTCVTCCLKSIKTTSNKIFTFQCCLEALGKHCTKHLPVQCCPKRIKKTLNKLFSCAMLYGVPETTLSRVQCTCAVLSQEY